ncbi:GGDEF domain-containing protein [Rahnella sikkimica]|uniref:diguanylate cyclase n=1 Tax=Rahnella sikkimica TaxID=1805933 RepID=A0A2L1UN38_9GAMM|nr:GGDEF domain-containing protein [Rahnella sikkimica]AVF34357.1 GGDEF domain-containing protein [Rahnella sikkimica]
MTSLDELFTAESAILQDNRELAETQGLEAEVYRDALIKLTAHYQKIMNESYRLIRRSDRAERDLNQLNERLAYEATHDPLTQVFNRSAIIDQITKALNTGEAGLILLDIDHFKAINDQYGHPAGDAVICGLIRRIEQSVPDLGSIGRVGGEEFTILLPRYTKAQSVIVAGYIHALLNASPLDLLPNQLVTASLGVSWGKQNSSFDTLYNDADTAMYEAKRRGRNRVHCG